MLLARHSRSRKGTCGFISIGTTTRRVYAFIAVLCYSRLCFLKFSLSQNAPAFYRALVEAFGFFGGLPQKLIFDNLKPAVLDGHGRHARLHETTKERPTERFQREKPALRPLPEFPFDTDEDWPTLVSTHARVRFDANRYSVPPEFHGKTVAVRANELAVWVLFAGQEIARHPRCYEKHQLLSLPQHHLAALQQRQRARATQNERAFDALGPVAQAFHFSWPDSVPKESILRLCDCQFISQHGKATLIGTSGTGKTHLLIALGYRACELGFSVRYSGVIEMLNGLITAQLNGTLEKAIRAFTRPALLLLDELGYLAIDKRGADLLFQVVATRYESGSIVLTTNRRFCDWGKILDQDNTVATAMIDRLMHHGEALVIKDRLWEVKEEVR